MVFGVKQRFASGDGKSLGLGNYTPPITTGFLEETSPMRYQTALAIAASAALSTVSSVAMAQDAEPSYKADPSVYKVVFENQYFRVIEANKEKGQRDRAHSHPVQSVVYFFTDCSEKLTGPDGQSRNTSNKAGHVVAPPIVKSHTSENIGSGACHQLFVERK